jgi:hypothetical protein
MQPSLKDLGRILVHPRETMRRILDSAGHRWTAETVVLAAICSSVDDTDVRGLEQALPGLKLSSTLALITLSMVGTALMWLVLLFLFSWAATLVGRRFEGQGTVSDVRAALAWSLVPVIWSVVFRIPAAIYRHRFVIHGNSIDVFHAFIEQGGCAVAIVFLAMQLLVFAGVVALASFNVAEAMRMPTWKGFATVAIAAATPVIIAVAAALALNT